MKFIKSILSIAVVASMFSCGNQVKEVTSLETEIDSASYALGLDMAFKVKANLKGANKDLFIQGYRNGIDSTNILINAKDMNLFLRTFFQKQQMAKRKEGEAKAALAAEAKFGHVKKAGEDFLAKNKNEKGVKTTASGLQYLVIKEGKGAQVKPTDKIKIHYHGTTIDGKVFDSTVVKNKPYEAGANQFIPGFNEGLALMKEGGKYKFFIPQNIGYKAQQRGQLILPFSALIFEVEVLEIKK